MEADELRLAGRALWGRGWQTRLAESLGVAGSSVRRWIGTSERTDVPPWARAHIRLMQERQTLRGAFAYARQAVGAPVPAIPAPDDGHLASIGRLLAVPGVKDPKRMPAIVADQMDGSTALLMTGADADDIDARGVSFIMTRHPDPWHLEGYLSCAREAGHSPAVTRHVDHYYSLIACASDGPDVIVHQIATHRAVLRTVWSFASAPHPVLREELRDMLPEQIAPELPSDGDGVSTERGRPAGRTASGSQARENGDGTG